MPMWECDIEGCKNPSVRSLGQCILCDRHLCSQHLRSDVHKCPKWEEAEKYDPAARAAEQKEIERLLQKINIKALAEHASALRDGIACSIPLIQYDRERRSSVMGGMNYHIDLNFGDGTIWMARIRRFNATSPPPQLRDYILQSEVATLKFLEQTSILAPKVFDYALEGPGNPLSVSYILMEKLPGKSLCWSIANNEQRTKVVAQLADVYIELRKYPFDKMGCLDQADSLHIGPFARESLTDFHGSKMLPLGPFSSLEEYHVASIKLVLDLILRDEMYSDRAVDAYLIHRFLLDIVPSVIQLEDNKNFFLKHADDKGDHILVDEDYNITGIIDWEWAYTAPESIAFNSPIAFLPVSSFYNGVNTLEEEESKFAQLLEDKAASSLGKAVRYGRLQHRFSFCNGYDPSDWSGFLGLFRGLRDAVGTDSGLEWEEWKQEVMKRYRDDEGLQVLLRR